jgi:hypothetical protein
MIQNEQAGDALDPQRDGQCLLAVLALVVAAYCVCATGVVAHGDDYWLLWNWRQEPARVTDVWQKAGRWASGLIFRAAWGEAHQVADLARPRLAAIAGIALLAAGLFASLRRLSYSRDFSLGLTALAALLPVFSVYASWATCCGHVYACLAAMAAFWVAEALGAEASALMRAVLALPAAAVLYVGFSIYQPAAMFYVVLLMLLLASSRWPARGGEQALRVGLHGAILLVAMAASYATYRAMTGELADVDISRRAEVTTDLYHKLGRFVLQPVGQSCLPFFFVNHWPKWLMGPLVISVMGLVVPAGVYRRLQGTPRSRWLRMLGLLALLPVAYLPNLIVANDFFPHRTRPAIAVTVLFLMALASSGLLRFWIGDEARRRQVARGGLAILVAIGLVMTWLHLATYFIMPSQVEWGILRAEVHRAALAEPQPRRVVFLMPDSRLPLGPRFIYDEFGYLASSSRWNCRGAIGLAVLDAAPGSLAAYERAEVVLVPVGKEPPTAAEDTWLLNGRVLNDLGQWRTSGYPLPEPPMPDGQRP